MNRTLTFLLFFLFTKLVVGQTLYSEICNCSINVGEDGVTRYSEPIILDKQSSESIKIIGIRKYKEYFEIALKYTCFKDSSSYSIGEPNTSKAWYVYSNGRKYNLINASWMLNGPNKVMRKGAEAILHIYFEPVGKDVEKFDLIEGSNPYNASSWHFYGIRVKNHPSSTPPIKTKNDSSDDFLDDIDKFMIGYEADQNIKINEIAKKINREIATSICPITAKNFKFSILSKEDKGKYIILDLKNEWTGAACYPLCNEETYVTKEKIYINEGYTTRPTYEISKIENYYQSPNVAKVWSTSDVVAGLAVLVTGAAILSSGDDSKKSSSSTTSSSGSSSSSSTYSSSRPSTSSGTNSSSSSSSSSSGSSGSYNSSNSSQNQAVTKPCYTVKENKTKDILGTTVPYIKVECGKYGNTKEFIYWTKAQGIIHNNGRIGWRVDEQTGYYKYSGGIPITISFLDVDLEKAIKKECSCRDY